MCVGSVLGKSVSAWISGKDLGGLFLWSSAKDSVATSFCVILCGDVCSSYVLIHKSLWN